MKKKKTADKELVTKSDEETTEETKGQAEATEDTGEATPPTETAEDVGEVTKEASDESAADESAADASAEEATEVPEDESASSEDTAKSDETEETVEGAAPMEDAEKGVRDSLDKLNNEKMAKLNPIFKAIRAFQEAVFEAPNENSDLKSLVDELASILTATSSKQLKAMEAGLEEIKEQKSAEIVEQIAQATAEKTIAMLKTSAEETAETTTETTEEAIGEAASEESEAGDADDATEKSSEGNADDEGSEGTGIVKTAHQDVRAGEKHEFASQIMSLTKSLEETNEELDSLKQSATDPETDRDESIETEKSLGEGESVDIFANLFPLHKFGGR